MHTHRDTLMALLYISTNLKVRGLAVLGFANRIEDSSSNPGRDFLSFTFALMLLRKRLNLSVFSSTLGK